MKKNTTDIIQTQHPHIDIECVGMKREEKGVSVVDLENNDDVFDFNDVLKWAENGFHTK